ncbi:MraZ N-terminal domain-containing protein [Sphingomonas sp. LT1P40]|uniref:MraZ N-terminal domain-containing protein n=1 Tax=Alteristakelama amylovorans TaxID=3096166 RepID=UPI002FC8C2B1
MTYHAKVIAGGKIVIPAEFRRDLGIQDGDFVLVDRSPTGTLTIRTHSQIIREGQERFRAMLKRPFTVDEYIAEKRADAEHE